MGQGRGKQRNSCRPKSTFTDAGWDFIDETDNGTDRIWIIDEDQDYPRHTLIGTGSQATPFLIRSRADFERFRMNAPLLGTRPDHPPLPRISTWAIRSIPVKRPLHRTHHIMQDSRARTLMERLTATAMWCGTCRLTLNHTAVVFLACLEERDSMV